ncbi:MAG TPA: AAA family ATPase [Candidatus Limnocylindria bacterium]|nr:AAA family ATPase [Candidatus Limnocylindria bacterium]
MPPTLVFIVGPPAVGKMTVGAALAARTGLKLFHNHRTIDLVLPFFAFGSPPFGRLINEFRRRIMEEVASSDLPGLIFTYVWAFDQPSDDAEVGAYSAVFKQRGGAVFYVELQASQAVRLQRNETEFRLAEKPLKRNLVESRRLLISADDYQLDSGSRFEGRADYLRIDNTDLSPEDVADKIIRTFKLDTRQAL